MDGGETASEATDGDDELEACTSGCAVTVTSDACSGKELHAPATINTVTKSELHEAVLRTRTALAGGVHGHGTCQAEQDERRNALPARTGLAVVIPAGLRVKTRVQPRVTAQTAVVIETLARSLRTGLGNLNNRCVSV